MSAKNGPVMVMPDGETLRADTKKMRAGRLYEFALKDGYRGAMKRTRDGTMEFFAYVSSEGP
jgi:hypothetical protein